MIDRLLVGSLFDRADYEEAEVASQRSAAEERPDPGQFECPRSRIRAAGISLRF